MVGESGLAFFFLKCDREVLGDCFVLCIGVSEFISDTGVTDGLTQTKAQHQAVTEQFTITLEEKDRQLASLEHRIKLLLLKIRGSRQEKIDPDQLVLFFG